MPPDAPIVTVTSWNVATDRVAVSVTVLVEFSSIADALENGNQSVTITITDVSLDVAS